MRSTPGRIIVELDDKASALVRDYLRNGHECLTDGHDPRDLVTSAVVFLLEDPDDSKGDWFSSDDALSRARERRLAIEGRGRA